MVAMEPLETLRQKVGQAAILNLCHLHIRLMVGLAAVTA